MLSLQIRDCFNLQPVFVSKGSVAQKHLNKATELNWLTFFYEELQQTFVYSWKSVQNAEYYTQLVPSSMTRISEQDQLKKSPLFHFTNRQSTFHRAKRPSISILLHINIECKRYLYSWK